MALKMVHSGHGAGRRQDELEHTQGVRYISKEPIEGDLCGISFSLKETPEAFLGVRVHQALVKRAFN